MAIVVALTISATSLGLIPPFARPTPVSASGQPTATSDAASVAAATPTVELGKSAVNGAVRAAVVDPATGTTYLGGQFTEIGQRTGAVAVVDPPDVGDGDLRVPSPEVVGRITAVFADDRSGDPGFFIVGRLTAINGVAVAQRPVHRMHLSNGKWVLDPSWVVPDGCHTGNANFPIDAQWIVTPTHLVAGGYAGSAANGTNSTGITLIERATGARSILGSMYCNSTPKLFPTIPPLPDLAGCRSLSYCYAAVGHLAYDPTSQHLIVHYSYAVGPAGGAKTWDGIAAYDMRPASGGRAWVKDLEAGPPPGPVNRRAWVAAVGALPGAFLIQGEFPLDADTGSERDISRTLLIDALTGTIQRRWDAEGEQDADTGAEIGPADGCLLGRPDPQTPLAVVSAALFGWLDGATLCRYRIVTGAFEASTIGSFEIASGGSVRLPTTHYRAPDGDQYLLGSNAAVNLNHGVLADWDPDPAVSTADPRQPSVATIGDAVIVGGDFTFVRGRPSPGIAALNSAMAPILTFTSPLRKPTNTEGVNALALSQGRLIIGGAFLLPGDVGSVVAVDAATGALDAWSPADSVPIVVDDLAVAPNGDFWVSGFSDSDAPTSALQHYASIDAGGGLLASPDFTCLKAPVLPESAPSEPVCHPDWAQRTRVRAIRLQPDGSLYVAGVFGKIDGVARRGLARFAADGTLSPWDPDLLGALALGSGQGLMEMAPYTIVVLSDRVVIGGDFRYVTRKANGGGGTISSLSPMYIFSASTASLVLPTDPDRAPWFPLERIAVYDIAHTDAGLFVAMGVDGLGIFDSTTFALDTAASSAFLNPDWWTRDAGNAIFVVAMPASPGSSSPAADTAASTTAAVPPGRVIVAGSLPRWRLRVAGNVVRATVTPDVIRPTNTAPRAEAHVGPSISAGTVPVRIAWSGADPGGSGVRRHELSMSTSGGSYAVVSTTLLRPQTYLSLKPGRTYRFRARAVDFAGNVGAWVTGRTITPVVVEQTSSAVRFSTGWAKVSGASYSGGSIRVRSVRGSSATYTFTGQAIGLVSTMTTTRGLVRIYVDGKFQADVDLRSTMTRYRKVVWQKAWSTAARHTIKVVVLGTSSRPRVDVDAFVVIR